VKRHRVFVLALVALATSGISFGAFAKTGSVDAARSDYEKGYLDGFKAGYGKGYANGYAAGQQSCPGGGGGGGNVSVNQSSTGFQLDQRHPAPTRDEELDY
jgi:hypothetical protein